MTQLTGLLTIFITGNGLLWQCPLLTMNLLMMHLHLMSLLTMAPLMTTLLMIGFADDGLSDNSTLLMIWICWGYIVWKFGSADNLDPHNGLLMLALLSIWLCQQWSSLTMTKRTGSTDNLSPMMIWLCWIFRSADDLAILTTWLSLSDNLGPLTIWICWYLLTIALLLMLLADNGSADNGSADNGSADNCSAEIDSANDGPCWNGCWFASTDNLAPLTILLFWQLLLMAIALFAMTPVDDCDDENDHCCWYLCWQWIMLMSTDNGSADNRPCWR